MDKKTKFMIRVVCWILAGLMLFGGVATLVLVLF